MKTYLKPASILLALIVLLGFFFRLKGISTNHSFWSDEAYVATLARDMVEGSRTLPEIFQLYNYQRLHLLITAGSMLIFGTSEFAARLPSVIFSTIGIVMAYLLAKRFSNEEGGILAAFLYAFAQVNLSYATQAKTYAALETLFLAVLYLISYLPERNTRLLHGSIILLASLATLFHFLGILTWIPYGVYLILQHRRGKRSIPALWLGGLIIMITLVTFFFVFNGTAIIRSFIIEGHLLFSTNNISLFREIFWRNYAFITLPSIVGIAMISAKQRRWTIALLLMMGLYVYLWNFKLLSPRIRYVLPLFGMLFVFFGVFWGNVVQSFFPKLKLPAIIVLICLLYAGGYKVVRKPAEYYSPNADLFADVQNADYQTFYNELTALYPDLTETALFTNWGDTVDWYLPEKQPDAYFRKGGFDTKPQPSIVDGVMVYGSLEQFLLEKEQHERGVLIVEDWESLLPEEIKQYAKAHMKRELRVEHLSVSPTDTWPLELYSWGFEEGGASP